MASPKPSEMGLTKAEIENLIPQMRGLTLADLHDFAASALALQRSRIVAELRREADAKENKHVDYENDGHFAVASGALGAAVALRAMADRLEREGGQGDG